ncbi:hypothetical protein PMAYCL1PPCAC_31124, partial [Pristionchus mayeri]
CFNSIVILSGGMSDRGRLHFVNDLELGAFLWRHLSSKYETRTLSLMKHAEIIDRMEKAAEHHSKWRLSEDSLRALFEELLENSEVKESISAAVRPLHFLVEEEQEAGWLVELLPLDIERGGASTMNSFAATKPVLKEHLDVLLCLLSATVDQSDPFSATRLLSSIAPSVLPGLRKRATASKLNLVQALLSYSMTARIHEAGQDDEILSQSMGLLKRFDRTVDEIHEKMHEFEDDGNRTISSMLSTATTFLLSTEKYQNDGASIRKAQSLIQQQLKPLVANQKTMEAATACRNEDAPEYLTRRDRVARGLLDRFTALEISGAAAADLAMTPAFKTPQVTRVEATKEAEEKEVVAEECDTPKRNDDLKEHKWFISNTTPTPKRDDQPTSMSMYEELLDEEKENMAPFKKVLDVENEESENVVKKDTENQRTPLGEQTTPVRARPSGLRVRQTNERPVLGQKKTNEEKLKRRSKGAEGEGNTKRSKPLAANQTSLTRFFGVKN